MKEVAYNGELSKDILRIDDDSTKRKHQLVKRNSIIILSIMLVSIYYNYMPAILISSIPFTYQIIKYTNIITNSIYTKNKKYSSEKKVEKLINNLKENQNVNIPQKNLVEDSLIITKKENCISLQDYKELRGSVTINDIHVLDRNDQIKILREINESLKVGIIAREKSNKLYLLDDSEINKDDLLVKPKLVFKKK